MLSCLYAGFVGNLGGEVLEFATFVDLEKGGVEMRFRSLITILGL